MKNYITQFWQFGILESAEAEDNLRHRLELAEYGLAPTGLTVLIVHIYWYYLSENHHRLNRSNDPVRFFHAVSALTIAMVALSAAVLSSFNGLRAS